MNKLIPVEQRQFDFYGGRVTAVLVNENGQENVYVILRPLVESLGISWSGQLKRLKRDSVLNEVYRNVDVMSTEPNRTRKIKMTAIPLDFIEGFLFGISDQRVKPEFQSRLAWYRRQCYQVLHEGFSTTESMRRFYQTLGHEPSWIHARIEAHTTSTELSREWLERGVSIEHHPRLKDEISKGAFNLTTQEHKQLKGLAPDDKLQDHMSRIELVIDMFGDETTRGILIEEDTQGVEESEEAAKRGGKAASLMKKVYEDETGTAVVTERNYLDKYDPKLLHEEEE